MNDTRGTRPSGHNHARHGLAAAWQTVRFGTGMAILGAVFVVSHGLVLVEEAVRGANEVGAG